jgi:hypothetical protein
MVFAEKISLILIFKKISFQKNLKTKMLV